jgi:hypothetical protein
LNIISHLFRYTLVAKVHFVSSVQSLCIAFLFLTSIVLASITFLFKKNSQFVLLVLFILFNFCIIIQADKLLLCCSATQRSID